MHSYIVVSVNLEQELPEFEEMETELLLVGIGVSSAAYLASEIMLSEQGLVARTGLFLLVLTPGLIAGEMAVKHSDRELT
jgi:hypothetical protein